MYLSLQIFLVGRVFKIVFEKIYIFYFIFVKFCLVPRVQELHTSPLTLIFPLMEKHSSTALSINACPDLSAFIHVTVCFQGWATLLHFCEVTESALSVDD